MPRAQRKGQIVSTFVKKEPQEEIEDVITSITTLVVWSVAGGLFGQSPARNDMSKPNFSFYLDYQRSQPSATNKKHRTDNTTGALRSLDSEPMWNQKQSDLRLVMREKMCGFFFQNCDDDNVPKKETKSSLTTSFETINRGDDCLVKPHRLLTDALERPSRG
ncbi:hypothetical protein OUZ56_022684 [Daphnia magna]|uniref:Uncharacterized protein n=1 Tax=Daphnia magna TaxID=35525 RepID=A0ABR0AXB0_9CRUS|nr:hypothetical protein OUZ56_022684 [Daphnia magna]